MNEKKDKKKLEMAYLDIAIPQNAENLQLPDPSLLQFYKNYENRIIWIDDEITSMTLEYAKMIMQWNFEDKKNNIPVDQRTPIKVIFFSPGGELEVNNCLVDTIQLSTTKVIGINVGVAASSGCFIYLSCHERYTFPTAEFLLLILQIQQVVHKDFQAELLLLHGVIKQELLLQIGILLMVVILHFVTIAVN